MKIGCQSDDANRQEEKRSVGMVLRTAMEKGCKKQQRYDNTTEYVMQKKKKYKKCETKGKQETTYI